VTVSPRLSDDRGGRVDPIVLRFTADNAAAICM
jgi:hypothetical protein